MTSGEIKVFKEIADELRRIRRILESTSGAKEIDRDNSNA